MNQRTRQILEEMRKQRALDKLRKQQKQYALSSKLNTANNAITSLPTAMKYGQKAINTIKSFKAPVAPTTAITDATKAATSADSLTSGLGSTSAISDATKAATSAGNTASSLANTGNAISDATKAATTVGKTADTASKIGNLGNFATKAGPALGAVGGAISAGSNFAKGDHVNGALDVAKTGLMFVPGVGQVAAAAIQIGQMIKSALDKKRQKSIQRNMKRMAENEQLANEKKQDVIDTYGDNSLAINTMPQQSMLGGSTSPVNTLDGQILPTEEETSLPEAPVSSDALGGTTTGPAAGLGDISAILDEQDNANLGLSIPDAISMATTMGYGKPDVDSMLQGLNGGSADKASLIDAANINKPTTPDEIFSAKMGDFNTAEPQAPLETEITPNDPTTEYNQPSVADYAKQEISGQPVEDNTISGLIDKYRKGEEIVPQEQPSRRDAIISDMMGRFRGGVNNFVKGYQDNANTSFSEGDLAKGMTTGGAASAEPKTFLNRLGEVVGTGSRLIANPALQGLVAGAIKGANTGDWGTGLEYGVNWAANKAKSDNYYKRLNPDAKHNPILSNYNADDLKAHADYEYKSAKTNLQAPTAQWYYDQELANKRITPEEYNRIITAPGYDPDRRINLKQEQVNTKAENDARKTDAYIKNIENLITYRDGKLEIDRDKYKLLADMAGPRTAQMYAYAALANNRAISEAEKARILSTVQGLSGSSGLLFSDENDDFTTNLLNDGGKKSAGGYTLEELLAEKEARKNRK